MGSRAVHDTAADIGTDEEPPSGPELVSGLAAAWERYRAGDPVRGAMVASGWSWIYLRDSRLEQAVETAERS